MAKNLVTAFAFFAAVFIVDQYVKIQILEGYRWESQCISIVLAFNKGVAFSMFSFLDEYLKYIQITLLIAASGFILYEGYLKEYKIPIGILFGGGVSNIYDRFHHEGVVDYVYWHCGFDFAIFNFADTMIDFSILIILVIYFKSKKATI